MRRLIECLLLILIASWVAGCGPTSAHMCDGWKALHPTRNDIKVISTPFKREVLGHNVHGERAGCWKP
jgi:hypothetical protein